MMDDNKREVALKKSISIALIFGLLLPAVCMRIKHQDDFKYLISLEYFMLCCVIMVLVFIVLFLLYLRKFSCPKCSKSWSYHYKDHHIIGRSVYEINIRLLKIRMLFCSEDHLQETVCVACGFERVVKNKRKFIEFEREEDERI